MDDKTSDLLNPLVKKLFGDLISKTTKSADSVHPMFGGLVSQVMNYTLDSGAVDMTVQYLADALKRMFGDEYPTLIKADSIEWVDERGD